MKKTAFLIPLFFCMVSLSCMQAVKVTTKYAVPAIGVTEGVITATQALDEREEYYLGRSVAVNLLKTYKLSTDQKKTEYLEMVGRTVALHSNDPVTYGGYHFAILDSDEINAFACPGGTIFITKGILNMTSSEDELAAIIAHEVSHVNSKDGMNSVKTSRWTQLAAIIGSATARSYGSEGFGQIVGLFEGSVNDIVKTIAVNGYGREQELAADKAALGILSSSGYDPGSLRKVLVKYADREKSDKKGFFKTHPGTDARIEKLKAIKTTDLKQEISSRDLEARQKRFLAALGR